MKQHTQQLALIHEAYNALPDMQDGFRDVAELLLDMNEKAERKHRKGSPGGYPGMSITLAAKYFVIHHLLDGWREPDRYTANDIILIRNEVLYAQACAKRFHNALTVWVCRHGVGIDSLDYVELVR